MWMFMDHLSECLVSKLETMHVIAPGWSIRNQKTKMGIKHELIPFRLKNKK